MTAETTLELAELEGVIERGLATFVEVGSALLAIRDGRLYLETHRTFEGYCRERWGWTRQRASQVIAASAVSTVVDTANERQARELAPLRDDPEAMREAWEEANTITNGKPTAGDVREAVKRRRRESLTDEQRARVLELHASGVEGARIAELVGVTQQMVSRAVVKAGASSPMPRRRQPATAQTLALGKVHKAVRGWRELGEDEDYIPAPELARRIRVLDEALTFLTQKRASYYARSRKGDAA